MSSKIKFKDLSIPLKVVIVFVYVLLGFYGLVFLLGVISGVMG